jgi:hypothetical protein
VRQSLYGFKEAKGKKRDEIQKEREKKGKRDGQVECVWGGGRD